MATCERKHLDKALAAFERVKAEVETMQPPANAGFVDLTAHIAVKSVQMALPARPPSPLPSWAAPQRRRAAREAAGQLLLPAG